MRLFCFGGAVFVASLMLQHNLLGQEPEPFHLGGRTIDNLPKLTDEELATPQQQALLSALGGDAYGHRWCDFQCTGCFGTRRHALASNNKHYGGYWVGGGAPCKGDDPFVEEGTFGWDYLGLVFTKRVALGWFHGRRYQGGTGAYKTDGPKLHE